MTKFTQPENPRRRAVNFRKMSITADCIRTSAQSFMGGARGDVPTYLLCVRCAYLPVVCQMWLPVITGRQMTQPCRRCIRPQLRFSLSFYITATNNCAV